MNQTPTSQAPMSTDVTSDDKLWALLAYVLTPIVPVIIRNADDIGARDAFFMRPATVEVTVLPPISIAGGERNVIEYVG